MKPILHIDLNGSDGNIFVVIGRAAELLKRDNQRDKANNMKNRVIVQESYEDALKVINEYVEIKEIVGYESEPIFEVKWMIKNKEDMSEKGIEIDLTSPQGNAFYLLGMVNNIGRQLGFNKEKRQKIHDEMTSGDYENLIKVFDKNFGGYVTLYR